MVSVLEIDKKHRSTSHRLKVLTGMVYETKLYMVTEITPYSDSQRACPALSHHPATVEGNEFNNSQKGEEKKLEEDKDERFSYVNQKENIVIIVQQFFPLLPDANLQFQKT